MATRRSSTAVTTRRSSTAVATRRSSSRRWSTVSAATRSSSTTQQLADIVVTAAESSRKINKQALNIAQLRVSNMKLHGRDDEVKLLRSKLRELAKNNQKDDGEGNDVQNNERHDDENPNKQSTDNNLTLVSGTSGTGKSALIHKGLGEYATNRGYSFASGKFDAKLFRPLSAFSDAMASLAKCIAVVENNEKGGSSVTTLIRDKIRREFDEEDVEQLRRVLPGCSELLGSLRPSLCLTGSAVLLKTASSSRLDLFAGKESISQTHYAIRRLLKIICSNLKGVILFIDDLQWSDVATLDLLKSIILDGEIPNLLIVGAYREDEVPE